MPSEQDVKTLLMEIQANLKTVRTSIDKILGDRLAIEHPFESPPCTINVGPVELKRAANLIKNMGFKPKDAESDDRAQTGEQIVMTDRSIWLCPRCVIAITDLEYRHLNLNGCCMDCETKLEQYEKVEWRP